MRLFGYYALHSFVNQVKKLCKTWVVVFLIVCLLLGVLIGFGAAALEDVAGVPEEPVAEEIAEPQQEEDSLELSIEPAALVELIAGGAILLLFFFEAVSADKNGSRIFLPADVNLLFPSPMKPQSVLMFRLGTQLGTALVATIYIVFQLPNLMLNLGLSGWGAAAILVTWFFSILIGKLLQVMLYTICSSTPGFKKYLRKGVYALVLILGLAFFAYFKTSGLDALAAADRFFNAPVTRWIPFWGWLKGLAMFVGGENWAGAALCTALLAAGCAGLVFLIWHINADFYEDAMAKSEETAALLEKANSEKTSGTAATRQRKKERKSSLLRDGLNHGWGANIFFHKTMYNRFRFAHFHFFTKTMETYLVTALGVSAALRFYFGTNNPLAVVLTLGGLVFFRAMANPLAEDTGMDFFRLIPESTWQKLFYSLLGGTVNCLLDLLLPMLAASALLMVNPMKLLIWLPLIVSVDFYAVSVVSFIDLSVPGSIGKTIKQLITILFIYFGLLPDIAALAFGIALGHTALAAVGATVINLALGVAAFSLASVFLQPKGRDYIQAVHQQDLKKARKMFSRLGFAVFAIFLLTTVVQYAALLAAQLWFPAVLFSEWGIWLLTMLPQYLVAMPVGMLLMRRVPSHIPQHHPLGLSRGVKFFFISIFAMFSGNIIGNLVTMLASFLTNSPVQNPLNLFVTGENLAAELLFMVILAPLYEELIFRKMLIDRMNPYGGKTAVVLSALLFGLFHGNFNQFFYAFGLGLVFGYIYLNTGKLRYTVIAHMLVNFISGVCAQEIVSRVNLDGLDQGQSPNGWFFALAGYGLLLVVGSIIGLVLLCVNKRSLKYPAGSLELPRGSRVRVCCLNVGMGLILVCCAILMIVSVLPQG